MQTTDARGVGGQLHRDNGIVVGRRVGVDYDDDDSTGGLGWHFGLDFERDFAAWFDPTGFEI